MELWVLDIIVITIIFEAEAFFFFFNLMEFNSFF